MCILIHTRAIMQRGDLRLTIPLNFNILVTGNSHQWILKVSRIPQDNFNV